MSPRLDWSHRAAAAIPHIRAEDVVHQPALNDVRYRVVETDGVIALLERLDGQTPRLVKRYVRSLAKVK